MQEQQQPGWTFQPGQQQSGQPQNTPAPVPNAPQPQPHQQTPQQPAPTPTPQPAANQQHSFDEDESGISWTASEYVAHEKGSSWFLQFLAVSLIVIVAAYFITGSIFTVVVLAIFAMGFMVLAHRKPQVLNYHLSDNMISVAGKSYALHDFKSFAIIEEGQLDSISLTPLKRFMPALDIYFAPDDEDDIAEFLSQYLPVEHRKQDMLDKFMHKIRF